MECMQYIAAFHKRESCGRIDGRKERQMVTAVGISPYIYIYDAMGKYHATHLTHACTASISMRNMLQSYKLYALYIDTGENHTSFL